MKNFAILAFLLAGCINFDKMPNQDEVVKLIWNDLYGMTSTPPQISWKIQDELHCRPFGGEDVGFYPPKFYLSQENSDTCVTGISFEDWQVAYVAWPDNTPYKQTALAHELWHYSLWDRGLPHGHENPGFGRAYGHPTGIVDDAWTMLDDAGY